MNWLGSLLGIFLFIFLPVISAAQHNAQVSNPISFAVGTSIGETFSANTNFPERKAFSEVALSLFWKNIRPEAKWNRHLWYPNTGIEIGFSDFGNNSALGQAFSMTSFMELDFSKKKKRLQLKLAAGLGYFNRIFDDVENPFNKAITKPLNITFRTHLQYSFLYTNRTEWRAGIGVLHYSNGHNRLPNQGLNTLAFQFSGILDNQSRNNESVINQNTDSLSSRSKAYYVHSRFGLGQNVLSRIFNEKKEVYTASLSIGKIINDTFKLGIGLNYRFYQHYYDYIRNNEELVQNRFSHFKDHPFWNASNFGINISGEILMGHIGAELDIGLNIHKPAYKIDWILNDGFTFLRDGELVTVFGELNDYFRIKRAFPARLGLKYYLTNTQRAPKHNFYLGAHINANLGQADFTEISFGYVKRLENSK